MVRRDCFTDMRLAIDDLDMDRMGDVISKMSGYSYEPWQEELFDQLKDAAEDVDVDRCEEIMQEWESRSQ